MARSSRSDFGQHEPRRAIALYAPREAAPIAPAIALYARREAAPIAPAIALYAPREATPIATGDLSSFVRR